MNSRSICLGFRFMVRVGETASWFRIQQDGCFLSDLSFGPRELPPPPTPHTLQHYKPRNIFKSSSSAFVTTHTSRYM